MARKQSDNITLAVLSSQFGRMQVDLTEIKTRMENQYATKDELEDVKKDVSNVTKLVYGVISIIAVPVIGILVNTLLGLIIKK